MTVSTSTVNLNPAQQQVVTIAGAAPPLETTLDKKLVTVTADPAGTSVTITATQATGSDVLHVTDAAGASADIAIRVAFNAGTIVPQTTLTVTGNPAQPDWLAHEVATRVAQLTQAQPGANVTIGSVAPPAAPLVPGASTQFVIPVQIAGNGQYFDLTGSTTVTVQNTPAAAFLPALLFYDDDPEHLTQDGVLFRGTVSFAQPARLYYYHDDGTDPRRLVVALQSNAQAPTTVQLIDAAAGPNIDVMQVGQSLTKRFLSIKSGNEGTILDLPQEPYLLTDVPMTSRQLVAGTVDFQVLAGGPATVTVLSVSPGVDPRSLLDGPVQPDDGHHRTGVFSIAGFGGDRIAYSAGSPDASVVLGDTAPSPKNVDPSAKGHDYGDYGVVHTVDLSLSNPGSAPASVYLFLQPTAGPTRASFLIDGAPVDLGCVRVSTPYQVTVFQLAPSQSSQVIVQTMTDGGSFYPVKIGLTSTPPQPTAPPIDAPDGCFPKPQPSPSP